MNEEKISYSQMRRDFYEKYRKKILPFVQKFDNERKTKLICAILSSVFFAIIGSIIILYILYLGFYVETEAQSECIKTVINVAISFYGVAIGSWCFFKKKFENKIKRNIMPVVCSCFPKLRWSEGFFNGADLFLASYITSEFDKEEYDDCFEGIFKDVYFQIVEAKYKKRGSKSDILIFDGVIIKLDMNKFFQAHTVVVTNTLFKDKFTYQGLRHTTLEDVEFEKKFDVYTNDEVEARYLITPSFMQRLKAMKIAFKARSVSCAFYNNYLIIALPTDNDIFSLCSLTKPVDDAKQYFQMYEEIVSIIKLIDHFKLNQKIGL